MLPFRLEKSNFSPIKRDADLRVDCRSLFSAEHLTPALSPTEGELSQRDQFFESARESTLDIILHGAPLPLAWVLVLDNIIPDFAVPFSEAHGGPQFIARAFLEGQYCIGKAGTGLPFGALITYAGRQLTVKRYEVLCFATEMRWNITQERQGYQQSSFIASNTAKFSHNSFCTSRAEIAASTLLESDIMRVIPDERMERSRDYLMQKRQCSSPLSPISRHVIEEICSSAALETQTAGATTRLAQSRSLSVLPIHHKDKIESCNVKSASQALPTHSCSRACGCDSRDLESYQMSNSQATRSSKLFTEMGQAFQKIRRLGATTQSHRSPDLTNNEQDSATSEQSQVLRRTRSLSGVLPTRLSNSRRTESTLERRNDEGPTHDVPIATSPRVHSCLSPIAHFSLPEPFDDSAGSVPAVRTPQKLARSIEHVISRNYQDEAPSDRMIHTKPSGVVRMSSPLAGRRQLPVFGLSGAGHRHLSLHDTEGGSSPSYTEVESFYKNANPPQRTLDSTNSAWVGASSHERKPHIRPIQHLFTRPTASPRSIRKSLADLEEGIDDREAAPVTLTVDRHRPHAQDRGTAVKPELRRLVASEPSVESSARSSYRSKGDKLAKLRSSGPSVTVPLIIVSPSANTRELPESPPSCLRSLDVSVDAHHSRFGSDPSLSGERRTSSNTRAISPSYEATAAVTARHTDDSPALSPSILIADINEDDSVVTRSLGYARSPTVTTVERTLKGQYPSDATPIGRTPVVAGTQYKKLDKYVPKAREPDVVVEGSWVPEAQGRVRFSSPASPQLPGPKLRTAQYVTERDDVGESHGYVSVQDTPVCEIEKTVVQSLHSDMILTQPSKGTFDYTTSPLSSYLGGRSVRQYDSIQATDVTKGHPISQSQATVGMMTSDSLSLDGHPPVAREKLRLARKPVPHGSGTLAQVENTGSNAEASRKVLAEINPSSEVDSVHSPPGLRRSDRIKDAGYRPGRVEDEESQDLAHVGLSWDERTNATAASVGQKYQVPLSEYLKPDDESEVSRVISKERRNDDFRRDETSEFRIRDRETSEGSSGVVRETEGEAQATETFTDNDKVSSRQHPSKHGDSVVSTVIAAAGIAAAVFEAVAESRRKERSEREQVKLNDRNKVSRDYDFPAGTESPSVHEDDVALNCTVEQTIVADSRVSSTVATKAAVALEGQTDIHCSSLVGVETHEGCVDHANGRPAADISANVYTKESTESTIAAKKAISAEQTQSDNRRTIENTPLDQRQTQVQASERPWLGRSDDGQPAYAAQSCTVAPREQKAETLGESGANQYASLDVTSVVTRTSDQLVECPTTIEGQVIRECKTTSSERESEHTAEPRSNSASQEHTIIVVSPQVCVNVQQTTVVTATNDNTMKLAGSTPEDQRGQLAETVAAQSDTSAEDIGRGGALRSMPGSREDVESSWLVESPGSESCTSSERVVAGCPLNPISKPVAVDTRPFTQDMTVAPIPVASPEQPNIVVDGTRMSIRDEVTEAIITGTSATSKVEDTVNHRDRVDRAEHGISQPQPSPRTLRNATQGTTSGSPLSLDKNHAILSPKSSDISTETRPLERSDRNIVIEKQLDRVAGARKLGAVGVRDATGVQKSIPLVRPGYITRGTVPRKSASFDLSKARQVPEKTRAATIYNAAGVAMNRADLSRPGVIKKPLSDTDRHANDLQRSAGPSASEAQTTSKEGSFVHPNTRAEVIEGNFTRMLPVQKSNDQAEYAGSKPDLRDMNDVEERLLKIYTVSSECTKDSSSGDSTYSVGEASDSLTWSEKACQKTLQQGESAQEMTKAEVAIQSNSFEEQREVFVELSKLSVDVKNASSLSSVNTSTSTISETEHDPHFSSASPHEEKSLPEGTGLLESVERSASLTRTSASCDSKPGSYRESLDSSVKDERTIDIDLSATHLISARHDERRLKPGTDTDSQAILCQLARGQSLDLVAVEGIKENQDVSESQVQITTVVTPAVTVVDHSHDASSTLTITAPQTEASEDKVFAEDISRAPPGPLSPASLAPPPDNQTDAAQTIDSGIASACAVVAITAVSQLSKEFAGEDTSSTKVMRQEKQSEFATGKRYNTEGDATYSERETPSVATDYSDQSALSGKKDDAPIPLTRFPRQSSIEHRQTVSDIDLESESTLYKETAFVSSQTSSHAEQTQTAEESAITMSATSSRRVAKGATRTLRLDIGCHSTGSVQSSSASDSDSISLHIGDDHSCRSSILTHQLSDKGGSPPDLQKTPEGYSPTRSPHVPYFPISDSPPSSLGETPGVVSRFVLHSPANLSPVIPHASPLDYLEPQSATAAALAEGTHGIIAKRDVEIEEHDLTFSAHTASSSKVTTERNGSEIHVDIDSDLRVAKEPSTLSPSPFAPITSGEGCAGDHADQVVEKYGKHFSELASSGVAQEEQRQVVGIQTISEMNRDNEWQTNTWVPSEPPPSYQDAISNYDSSPRQPNDVLSEDDHQSLRLYAQYREDTKLNTLDTSVDGVKYRSEEGSSVLERRGAFRATDRINDRVAEKSTLSEFVHAEDILGTRQEILTEAVRSPSKIDQESVLDEYVEVGSSECASSTLESLTARKQFEVDTLQSSRSLSPSKDRTTSMALEVNDKSRCQESLEHIATQDEECATADVIQSSTTSVVSTVAVQDRASVSTVDKEDAIHRRTQHLSTTIALQADEEVWDDFSHALPQADDNLLDVYASDVVAMESRGGRVVEDEQAESEDAQCASRVDGSDEHQINPLSSVSALRAPSHCEIENETITSDEHTVERQGTPQQSLTLESTAIESRIQTENIASTFDKPIAVLGTATTSGEDHVETTPSFTDVHDTQVSFDYTVGYLDTDTTDQHAEYVEEEEEEEEEEGSIDISQEISSQHEEHDAFTPSTPGSDYHLWESGEHTMINEEQQIRESPSRGSPVINIDTFIDERNKVSETVTTEKHDKTDIETDRADLVCPDLTQTTIRHEYKDVEGATDLTVSTVKMSSSVSQTSGDLDVSDSTAETQTSGRYASMNVLSNLDSHSHDQTEHVNPTVDEREQKETSQTTSCERTGGVLDDIRFKTRSTSTHPARDIADTGKPDEVALRNKVEQAEVEVAGDLTDSELTQSTVLEKALAAAVLVLAASDMTESRSRTPQLDEDRNRDGLRSPTNDETLDTRLSPDDHSYAVSVSVEDHPSLLPPQLTRRGSSHPSPSSPQTVTNTHTTGEFHRSVETAETTLAHEDVKVTLVGDDVRGQSSISSQPSVRVEICNDSSIGEEECIDEDDSMYEEDSTISTQASTSKLTDTLDRRSGRQPLVLSEASDEKESHSSRQQTSHTCLGVVEGCSLSTDESLVVPEVYEPQVSIGNSSIAYLESTPSKGDSLAPSSPPLSVTPGTQIMASGHLSGTQQLADDEEHRDNVTVTQIVSRPSIASALSSTKQSTSVVSCTVLSNSTTEDTLRVEETMNVNDASKDWTSAVMGIHSHNSASLQETMDGELWMSARETRTTRPSRPMLHRTPSFEYLEEFKKEWVGVDLYDIAEQGVLHRSLSRPFSPIMQSARYWTSPSEEATQGSDAQALVVSSQGALSSGSDRELDIETRESVLALSKTTGALRRASIVRGWGELGFARYVSVRGGMGHGPLDDEIHPGTIVRTTEHTQRPFVIVAAHANGQLFDEDKLAEHVLSCINFDLLDTPQELSLLCLVGQKTCEVTGALTETLYAIQDVLLYEGIEIGSASVEEVEMGYWVKVVVWRAQWTEDGGMHVIETDSDAQGSVVASYRRVPSGGSNRELDGAIRETVLALSKTTGMPRHDFIVWGWGKLGFSRYVSLQVQHGPLADDLQPGAIIRTTDHTQGPVVIVVAGASGQLFDEDELAERVLSCINPDLLETSQELSLLYLVGSKTSEATDALTETLYAIQDVLLCEGMGIGNASVEEVEMGYWVKVVLSRAQWIEDGEAHVDEGEDEGILSEVDSSELED